MRVGYARVSDKDQPMAAQVARLGECDRLFREHHTGRVASRPVWDACLSFVREGDTLVVTRLDRLARSVAGLCAIAAELERKGVQLVVLDQAIDTSSPFGKLVFHVIAAIAEFELDIRKQAQRAGIELARTKGLYRGAAPRLERSDQARLCAEFASGMRASALARRYRVSKSTVYRYVRAAQEAPPPVAP